MCFVRPNSSNDCRNIKSFNSIKTPKENNRNKIGALSINESGQICESHNYLLDNNNSMLQNISKPSKPLKSRNTNGLKATNLTYVKSQGSNFDNFSFLRPNNLKGDVNLEQKQKSKKSKKPKVNK